MAMNDPRVRQLRYILRTPPGFRFEADKLETEVEEFRLHLEDNVLSVDLPDGFKTVAEARKRLEPILEAWAMVPMLENNRGEISFSYSEASVVDLYPTPGVHEIVPNNLRHEVRLAGAKDARVSISESLSPSESVSISVTSHAYPAPPATFRKNEDVAVLWNLLSSARRDGTSLLMRGYSFVTYLEHRAEEEGQTVQEIFRVSRNVVAEMKRLCSIRGVPGTARKLGPSSTFVAPSPDESKWLLECMKHTVYRAGDTNLELLTLGDLPTIKRES